MAHSKGLISATIIIIFIVIEYLQDVSKEKGQSHSQEGWKVAQSRLKENSSLPSLRITPRSIFNETCMNRHCWGAGNGSPRVTHNCRQMHYSGLSASFTVLPRKPPRSKEGKKRLKVSRRYSWTGRRPKNLNNAPRTRFSSRIGTLWTEPAF